MDSLRTDRWGVVPLAVLAAILVLGCDRSPPAPAGSVPGGTATASAVLSRMKDRYANATSYRDHGVCTVTDLPRGGVASPELTIDFVTAFDRSKGLCWRTEQRSKSDPQRHVAIVASRDFVSFQWSWTLSGDHRSGVTAWAAFKDTLGNTGYMAGVVPAWLVPTMDLRLVRLDPTSLDDATRAADETIEGVTCAVIDADGWRDQRLRFWIDGGGALRRFRAIRQVPAAFDLPASTIETVIDFTPEFDLPVPEDAFCPDAAPPAP